MMYWYRVKTSKRMMCLEEKLKVKGQKTFISCRAGAICWWVYVFTQHVVPNTTGRGLHRTAVWHEP